MFGFIYFFGIDVPQWTQRPDFQTISGPDLEKFRGHQHKVNRPCLVAKVIHLKSDSPSRLN